MAVTITVPGGQFHLSGNPLWIKAEGATAPADATGYKVMIKVISEDGLLIGAPFIDAIAPDAGGQCWFDVSGYVNQPETKQFQFPLTGAISPYGDLTKEIHFIPGESWIDQNDELHEIWGSPTGTHHVISGGVSPANLGAYNDANSSFYADFVTGGRFLTWMPVNQTVAPYQPVKLWLLAPANQEVTLHIKAWYEDDSIHDKQLVLGLYQNILHEFNVLPYHVDSANMPVIKTGNIRMTRYEVWIEGFSETRTFTVDHNNYENCNYLIAANSIGGIDVVWLNGHAEHSFETETIQAVKPFPREGSSREHTVIIASRTGSKMIKINSGYKTAGEMLALQDLLLSRQVWLLQDARGYNQGTLLPVTVENSAAVLYDTAEDLYSMDIELREAHNSSYR